MILDRSLFVPVSTTATAPATESVTYAFLPSGVNATKYGRVCPEPTANVLISASFEVLMADTKPYAPVMYTFELSGVIAGT